MACRCTKRNGNRCIGTNSQRTVVVNTFDDLSALELRGNGGCGGTGSNADTGTGRLSGGDGGNGGGGLWISASGYDFGSLTLDTSGDDGQAGEASTITGGRGTTTVRGGSGAGGNSGRIVLVYDGTLSTVGSVDFVVSQRGRTLNSLSGCSGNAGDSNVNRRETPLVITAHNCQG